MSVFDEIDKIKEQKLASDLGGIFVATVLSIRKDADKEGRPRLKFELVDKEGITVCTTYRIPKARTGKGQLDKLEEHCEKLGIKLRDMEGMTFKWQEVELKGSVKGYPRHYPIKIVKQTKVA